MNASQFSVWIGAARPKTLPAAIAPVLVGAAEAYRFGEIEVFPVVICMLFALLVQVGTNMANDYYDCIRGADTEERLGPERFTSSGRIAPRAMLFAAVIIFILAFSVGLSLVWYRGWELLIIGVLAIMFGYGYTGGPYPLAYHGLGDVFVIIFFGLVATAGTFYAITGETSGLVMVEGFALGVLANNILVVNNLRDRETDRSANKNTLIVRFGNLFGVIFYRIQYLIAVLSLFWIWKMTESAWACLPLLTLPLGFKACKAMGRTSANELNPLLGKSAGILMLYSASLALGLVLSV